MPIPTVVNFSDTTPAPPLGGLPVHFQADANNPRNVSGYVTLSGTSIGGVNLQTASYLALSTDYSKLISFNAAGAVTLTLPSTPPSINWYIYVENTGAGALTISPNGLNIDGAGASLTLATNQGIYIATDGTNYYTERGDAVTSVALTVPVEFTVAGSPITSSGTFAITKATEAANTVWAGPTSGAAAQPTFRALVASDLAAVVNPYDLICSFVGKPGSGALVFLYTAVRALSFLANWSGAQGTCGTNPTATATYTVLKNGSSAGTVVIGTGGAFTFATSGAVSLAIGDRLTITAPSPQDATLADVAFTLAGTR